MKYARIIISGRVQGVGYRYFVYQYAVAHGLKGSVRNLPDGTVEVVCQADESAFERFIPILETGPRLSRVDSVFVQMVDETRPPFKHFVIE